MTLSEQTNICLEMPWYWFTWSSGRFLLWNKCYYKVYSYIIIIGIKSNTRFFLWDWSWIFIWCRNVHTKAHTNNCQLTVLWIIPDFFKLVLNIKEWFQLCLAINQCMSLVTISLVEGHISSMEFCVIEE